MKKLQAELALSTNHYNPVTGDFTEVDYPGYKRIRIDLHYLDSLENKLMFNAFLTEFPIINCDFEVQIRAFLVLVHNWPVMEARCNINVNEFALIGVHPAKDRFNPKTMVWIQPVNTPHPVF